MPALPPEMMLLPSWAPLNPYDFACWARQTIVALTSCSPTSRVRPLPFTLDELRRRRGVVAARRRDRSPAARWSRSTACCAVYERRPLRRPCASWRWRAPSAGSSTARRPTARGAGSSRRGSTR